MLRPQKDGALVDRGLAVVALVAARGARENGMTVLNAIGDLMGFNGDSLVFNGI